MGALSYHFVRSLTYYRFNLSHRHIEDLPAECSIVVSYETIRPDPGLIEVTLSLEFLGAA